MTDSTNKAIRIVEVGPRDGLQNEKTLVSTPSKLQLITRLYEAGLRNIEITSFVRASAIPQLADADELVKALGETNWHSATRFSALVPNLKGLERALEVNQAGVISEIAVLTAVSNTFNVRNINMPVEDSLTRMREVVARALDAGLTVRGYISTAFYCPYDGKMPAEGAVGIAQQMLEMGIREVSIGDTIGQATPQDVESVLELLLKSTPAEKIAMHFHDTNGLGLENVQASLDQGITTFDSSAGGMGGCPYAPGASGNLSTDALVTYLHQRGYTTGIDPKKLAEASAGLLKVINQTQTELRLFDGNGNI